MVTIRKMGKKLRNILVAGGIALASLFPMKANAQTQERLINQPTPLTQTGDCFNSFTCLITLNMY